jgi:hypothetical protein
MNLEAIREELRRPEARSPDLEPELRAALARHKVDAVNAGDQAVAKDIWCLEATLEIQTSFNQAFLEMRAGRYYEAWCRLEQAEVSLLALARHRELLDYRLDFIAAHTERFQSLFPYTMFFSPGLIVKERRCGLCDALITPRTGCDHRLGEIYDGVMCFHEIADAEAVEVSLVTNPVQKACIGWFLDSSGSRIEYDHSLVRYVVEGLQSPFHAWDYRWTKTLHPHSLFEGTTSSDSCPCESGNAYGTCCRPTPGVLRPHCQVLFAVPPQTLPSIEYVY